MPRVSEIVGRTDPPMTDEHVTTTCPTCGRAQELASATYDDSDPVEAVYGCGPILIVSRPGVTVWEGRGYVMDAWIIRNPTDLLLRPPGKAQGLVMPASPDALV